MRKNINFNKKYLILIIILILLIGYYIYYRNNNNYQEFEVGSNSEELLPENEKIKQEKGERDYKENVNLENEEIENNNEELIMVYITGEVKNWGVIELNEGSRIVDAVNKAGGFTESADQEKVNLAYVLSDGVKIYIPSKNEQYSNAPIEYITEDSGNNVITEELQVDNEKNSIININEATQTELETLPGIGPSIALKIITYREEQGKFSSIEDIKNVSGIGENKFESIKSLICV